MAQDPWMNPEDDDTVGPPEWPEDPDEQQGQPSRPSGDLPDSEALAVPQRPAGSIPRGQTHVQQLGPPPTLPQPKLWQRLAAGLVAGAGGIANAKVGYPGGPRQPIDMSGAVSGIYGEGGYQRKLSDWQNRAKIAEYQDTQDEKAREADMRDQETRSRILLNQQSMDTLAEQRRATAALRQQQAEANTWSSQDRWMRDKKIALPQFVNANPNLEEGPNAEDLPGADPATFPDSAGVPSLSDLPLNANRRPGTTVPFGQSVAVAPNSATPGGYQPVPMPPAIAGQYPKGAQAFQESTDELNEQKAIGNAAAKAQFVAPKAPTPTELKIRATGGHTGNPQVDSMQPEDAKKALAVGQAEPLQLTSEQQAAYGAGPDASGINTRLLQSLDPITQNNVQQLLDGRANVTAYQLARSPEWAKAADYAGLIDPHFDRQTYDLRMAGRKAFIAGPPAKNLVSLNTLSGHIDTMVQDLAAMQNGDQRGLNTINNWLHNEFGLPAANNAQAATTAVAGELATALKGNATDVEIGKWMESIKPNMSPAQIDGVKKTLYDIMWRRLNELDWQYQAIPGMTGKHPANLLSPNTANLLRKSGYNVDALLPGKPGAAPGAAPGQAAQAPVGGGKTVLFRDPSGHYNIPEEKVAAFLQAHPQAKPVNQGQ